MAQGPSTSIVQSFDTWYIEKRLADRFTGTTVNPSHQGQSVLQSSILAYWTLSGIDPGTKSSTSTTTEYSSGIGAPAVGLSPPPPPPPATLRFRCFTGISLEGHVFRMFLRVFCFSGSVAFRLFFFGFCGFYVGFCGFCGFSFRIICIHSSSLFASSALPVPLRQVFFLLFGFWRLSALESSLLHEALPQRHWCPPAVVFLGPLNHHFFNHHPPRLFAPDCIITFSIIMRPLLFSPNSGSYGKRKGLGARLRCPLCPRAFCVVSTADSCSCLMSKCVSTAQARAK